MCFAIPGEVIEIEKGRIIVDYGNEKRNADFSLVEIEIGDWVIVNNKMVVMKVDKEKAEKFLEVLK